MQPIDNYERMARAIEFLAENRLSQPNLEQAAAIVGLSPYHFQRLFTDWAGVSPKQFMQYLTAGHVKHLLRHTKTNLFDAAFEAGLTGTSRLHDLFVRIEGMTPGEYKTGGGGIQINYSCSPSPFGNIIIASTPRGICYMAFCNNETDGLLGLKEHYPLARLYPDLEPIHKAALGIFSTDWRSPNEIKLHLRGTPFQLKVWETLLKIPLGALATYGDVASIVQPGAARAVGTAIGANPVAFLIPCHRVIRSTGSFGNYMWGPSRKQAIIGWEASKIDTTILQRSG